MLASMYVKEPGKFGWLLSALVLVACVLGSRAQEEIFAWSSGPRREPTQLIVKYRDDLVSVQSAEVSITRVAAHPSFKQQRKMLIQNTYVVAADSAAGAQQLRQYIREQQKGYIEYVEYDLPLYAYGMPTECASTSSDCTDNSSKYWGLKKIKADHVWSKMSFGGTNILGGVIDTGVEWDHPELSGVVDIAGSTSCMSGSGTCSTTSPTINGKDDQSHGTHCAGIMAALHNSGYGTPLGVTTSGKLVSCKFMDSKGQGNTSGAADCIRHMINKGVKVISNSWGGDGTSNTLSNVVKAACQANILMLVAAGNEAVNVATGQNGAGSYPANYAGKSGYECVIAVAASDDNDRLTSFSNYGSNVQIAAPGRFIYSTVRAAQGSYAYYSGTSMATPMVAGAALALWNSFPSLSMQQVRDSLITTATVTPSQFNSTTGPIGGKVLDVEAAVARAQQLVGASPVNCVGAYTDWGTCSVTCGTGTQTRTYTIQVPAANGGVNCPVANGYIDSRPCDMGPCGSNCIGGFTSWAACDKACGGGSQTHTYVITTPATGTGTACPYSNGYTETQACNTAPCPSGPQDCVGGFTDWGSCSKPCGGGVQNRTYLVTTPALNGGQACSSDNGTVELQGCNTQPCNPDNPNSPTPSPPPAQSCTRNSQCSSRRAAQIPTGASPDCYTSSCTNGFCRTATKSAGARCNGGFCDGSGLCKTCLMQIPGTCPRSSPVCLSDAVDGSVRCGCSGDSSCPANLPICKDGKQCVQCLDNGGCTSQSVRKVCDASVNMCVQCISSSDCSGTPSTPFCDSFSRMCVQCTANSDCVGNTQGPVCNSISKTCGCSRDSDCPNLPASIPSSFDKQCLQPACSSMWAGSCTAAAVSYKACIVPGTSSSTNNGYCSVTANRNLATGATCVSCKAAGASCSVGGECCSRNCRNRNNARQCA